MLKESLPDSVQEPLFDLEAGPVVSSQPLAAAPGLSVAPNHIVPETRISAAQAELGGGIATAEARSQEQHLLGSSITQYEESRRLQQLARRGAADPAVKKAGGIRHCEALAKQTLLQARAAYLESQGLPVSLPDKPTTEQQDAFSESTRAWANFRASVLEVDEKRILLAHDLGRSVS